MYKYKFKHTRSCWSRIYIQLELKHLFKIVKISLVKDRRVQSTIQ